MKSEFTIVQLSNKLPLSFSVCHFDEIFPDASPTIRLILVMEGTCDITVGTEIYHAKKDDMIIINPFSICSFHSEATCSMLVCNINQYGFELEEEEAISLQFHLNTITNPVNSRYESLRYLIYSIIKFNTMDNINSLYTNRAIIFSLFAQLMNDFRIENKKEEYSASSLKINAKMLNYLHANYQKNITLKQLADMYHYNLSYLSRLFKKCQGKTFNDYYDQLRVNNSMNFLISGNKTMEEVAVENGFENARAYVRAFQKFYGCYPSAYRKTFQEKEKTDSPNDIAFLRKEVLNQIIKYYDDYNTQHHDSKEITRNREYVIEVDAEQAGEKRRNTVQKFLNIGDLKVFTRHGNDESIEKYLKENHFEYGIISGVFDRQYKRENEVLDRRVLLILDDVISSLLSYHIKPLLRFEYDESILPEQFIQEVKRLFDHLKFKFSSDEVKTWIVSLNSKRDILSLTLEEMKTFSYVCDKFLNLVKEESIKVMAPSFPRKKYTEKDLLTLKEFYVDSLRKFDFYSLQYDHFLKKNEIVQEKDELKNTIQSLKDHGLYFNKLVVENCVFTQGNNLLNDTLYASSYEVRNYLNNLSDLYAITYFTLSDLSNPIVSLKHPFQGAGGLFTFNGLKKASATALSFIGKLGGMTMAFAKNFIVTKEGDKIIILVNNYSHYSKLFAQGEYYDISEKERLTCFPTSTNYIYTIKITGLGNKEVAKVKINELSTHSGSSYDTWINAGGFENMKDQEYQTIDDFSSVMFSLEQKKIISGELTFQLKVAPLEMRLIEIEID